MNASGHVVSIGLGREIGVIDHRLFGSFVEHLGRGVYGGIYEPTHPTATAEGFRGDVLDLVRELGVSVVRYPGGNFVSGYDWRDGIGPRGQRPRRLDLAWKSIETNQFGTDEFVAWCRVAEVEPMLALNLGLGSVQSALGLLEYSNYPAGTTLSDERVSNGAAEPHNVRLWCLGNELDGPWQLGYRTAEQYGALAAVTASAMRMFDPQLELVAVGSSNAAMDTFGAWEATVLSHTIDLVDYLSCHIYFYNDGDLATFLRSADELDAFLDQIAATIRHAKTVARSTRDVRISLDEWNVWNFKDYDDIKAGREFAEAPPLLEQTYSLADAVVVGTLLQSIVGHSDVVSIAAIAQLVNAIGAIRSEPGGIAWRQSIFHPFAAMAASAGHTAIAAQHDSDEVICTVTRSTDESLVCVYLAHRGLEGATTVEIDLSALSPDQVESAQVLWHTDHSATNSAEHPHRVSPRPLQTTLVDGCLRLTMPALSWASIRVTSRSNQD